MSLDLDHETEERHGGIQVIARAARIMRALQDHPDGLSLGQIARSVGLARSTVQRIVASLAAEEFLSTQDQGGGVRIGPALLRLAGSMGAGVADQLAPHLRAFGEELGETVDLAILSGGSAVFVDQAPGRHRLVAVSAIGARFPLHCTANGKAMLACFSESDAADLIEKSVAEHPDYPLGDRRKLERQVAEARRKHLAFDLGEHGEGIHAVGAALLDAYGRPLAISIPVPEQRFAQQRDALAQKLLDFRERVRRILVP